MDVHAIRAISHAEGWIVVDTGETARATERGYFPRWHPYYRLGIREDVQPEQEIGPQLKRRAVVASRRPRASRTATTFVT